MARSIRQQSAELSFDEATALEILARIERAPFVGRAPQLALCKQAVEKASEGYGSVIAIQGESGSGKSRLLQEVRRCVTGKGGIVVEATCPVESGAPPYSAWIRAFDQLPTATAARLLAGKSDTGPPVPFHRWNANSNQLSVWQFSLFTDLESALRKTTDNKFMVILIDDLQWADPASLALLRFLGRRVFNMPLLVMAAIRSEDLPLNPEVQQTLLDLASVRATTIFHLEPLVDSDLEVHAMSIPGDNSRKLIQRLANSGKGNPLVLEKFVPMLVLSIC